MVRRPAAVTDQFERPSAIPASSPNALPPNTSGKVCRAIRRRDHPSSGNASSAAMPAGGYSDSIATPANARLAMCSDNLIQRLAMPATHNIAITAATPCPVADARPPSHHQ